MKKFKKLSALLLAAFMVLAMAVPAAADVIVSPDDTYYDVPAATDKGTLSVSGIVDGSTVKAYKLVEGDYATGDAAGLKGWKQVAALNTDYANAIVDANGKLRDEAGNYYLSEALINEIAAKINSGSLALTALDLAKTGDANGTITYKKDGEDVTVDTFTFSNANATPGLYVIITNTGDAQIVYNAALGSIFYKSATNPGTDAGTDDDVASYVLAMERSLDLTTDTWTVGETDITVKYSKIDVEKEIVQNSEEDTPGADSGKHGDDHANGDKVKFTGKMNVPSYSDEYFQDGYKTTYEINDIMDEGLELIKTDETNAETLADEYNIYVTIGGGVYAKTVAKLGKNVVKAAKAEYWTYEGGAEFDNEADAVAAAEAAGKDVVYVPAVEEQAFELSYPDPADRAFKIVFNKALIKAARGQAVTLDYSGLVADISKFESFKSVDNTLKVKFSNNPFDDTDCDEIEDKTHHYTFNIDGDITAKDGTRKGHEIIKTKEENYAWISWDNMADADKKKVVQYETGKYARLDTDGKFYEADATAPHAFKTPKAAAVIWEDTTYTDTPIDGLNGAVFELTMVKDADGNAVNKDQATGTYAGPKVWRQTTHDGGYMNFEGLDAGEYTLKEITPPSGYSLNTTVITVTIAAEYYAEETTVYFVDGAEVTKAVYDAETNDTKKSTRTYDEGELKSYTITRTSSDGTQSTKYTLDHEGKVTEMFPDGPEATFIKNVETPSLPSTGGMGTYLFTILGVALVGIAAFLLIFKRRTAA